MVALTRALKVRVVAVLALPVILKVTLEPLKKGRMLTRGVTAKEALVVALAGMLNGPITAGALPAATESFT